MPPSAKAVTVSRVAEVEMLTDWALTPSVGKFVEGIADALEVAAETKAIEVEGAQNIQITIMG
jgi:hypothetical protein